MHPNQYQYAVCHKRDRRASNQHLRAENQHSLYEITKYRTVKKCIRNCGLFAKSVNY